MRITCTHAGGRNRQCGGSFAGPDLSSLLLPVTNHLFLSRFSKGTTIWPDASGAAVADAIFRATADVRGCAEKLPVLTSSQDRAGSVSEHFFCDAAFHQSSQSAPAMRHHHNQIRG